jgi:hypothetical protein
MGIRKVTILASLLFVAQAMAFPVPDMACAKKGQMRDFANLIQKASIGIDHKKDENVPDPRLPLRKNCAALGLKDTDCDQVYANYGHVVCPGRKYFDPKAEDNSSDLGGMVIGGDDQILTARHAIFDDKFRPREPLSACFYYTMADPTNQISLGLKDHQFDDLSNPTTVSYRFGNLNPKDKENDTVVIKLAHRVRGATPFSVPTGGLGAKSCDVLGRCQKMVTIVAGQIDMPEVSDLIGESCSIRKVYNPAKNRGSVIFNDCWATEGASGGLNFLVDDHGNLVRDSQGRIVPFAMTVATSKSERDFLPFSLTEGSMNATKALGLDAGVADNVSRMARDTNGEQQATAAIPGATDGI